MTTLYGVLEKSLNKHNLSWDDVEAIVIKNGIVGIYDKDKGKEILEKVELHPDHYMGVCYSDIDPLYVYTKNRIFYVNVSDEMGTHWIGSLPRNPTDKEEPHHLPD